MKWLIATIESKETYRVIGIMSKEFKHKFEYKFENKTIHKKLIREKCYPYHCLPLHQSVNIKLN